MKGTYYFMELLFQVVYVCVCTYQVMITIEPQSKKLKVTGLVQPGTSRVLSWISICLQFRVRKSLVLSLASRT